MLLLIWRRSRITLFQRETILSTEQSNLQTATISRTSSQRFVKAMIVGYVGPKQDRRLGSSDPRQNRVAEFEGVGYLAGNKVVGTRNSLAATYGGIGRAGSTLVQAERDSGRAVERKRERGGKGKSRTRCSYQLRNDNCLPRLRDREARYQPSCRIMDSSRPSGFVSPVLVPSDPFSLSVFSPPFATITLTLSFSRCSCLFFLFRWLHSL